MHTFILSPRALPVLLAFGVLALLPVVDVRHGIGWGPVSVLGEEPRVEDGPGWWAARASAVVLCWARWLRRGPRPCFREKRRRARSALVRW